MTVAKKIVMANGTDEKIQNIRELREKIPALSLREAKNIIDEAHHWYDHQREDD